MVKQTVRRRRGRAGYAILSSIIMVTFLSMLGSAMFALSNTNVRTSTRRKESAQALNLAFAGMDEAIKRLNEDNYYAGFSDCSLGAGTITATITSVTGYPKRRTITSTGTVVGHTGAISRQVRCTVDSGKLSPVFYKGLAAIEQFDIGGTLTVGSSPLLGQGDVHCNNNVYLGGTSTYIDGDVTSSGTVDISGGPTVTGTITSGAPMMYFPEITQAFKEESLVNGTTTGNVTVSNGRLVKGKIIGDLTINNPKGCEVTGVVWVTGRLTVKGPVKGTGTIVCDGVMSLQASGTYADTDLNSLLFVTTSTDSQAVTLGGNDQFKGAVYCPYGGAKFSGSPTILGSVAGKTVTISGTVTVTRWTPFEDNPPPVPRVFVVAGYEEL